MKVCTDSCILGAWSALRVTNSKNILDIGTGTGLLALMLAQKSGASIDAIESDPGASEQARENIEDSPWREQIRLMEGDATKYSFVEKYDFIISNPPFYELDLHSPIAGKNRAKHDESLTLEQLLGVIKSCLKPGGDFSVLLPFHRTSYFENLAGENGFRLLEKLELRQTPGHNPFRSVLLFSTESKGNLLISKMNIKDENGKYSSEFSELMNEYYG